MPEMKYHSPLRRWDVLGGLLSSHGFQTYVEVGCKEGRLAGKLLEGMPFLQAWTIDPWRAFPENVGEGAETYETWDFGKIREEYAKNIAGHENRVEHLEMTSLEAAAHFEQLRNEKKLPRQARKGFDLVFLDAAHDQDHVEEDIDLWLPLVRVGGILCGHDYQHKFPGVMKAVANRFSLIRVGVLPDSVWCVMKTEDLV